MSTDLAGIPPEGTEPPDGLLAALAARDRAESEIRAVWANQAGGLTFAVGGELFAKWNPRGSGESLVAEAQRLRWFHGRHPVPELVELIEDPEAEILLTRALPGESAVSERWRRDPDAALRALGIGLRRLHELPIDGCPFEWSVETRIRDDRIPAAELGPVPPVDRLVVAHGDPCAPNTLIDTRGEFLAHLDLGRAGLADRWADLAVITLSFEWNYAGYDEGVFWRAYGADPDPARIDFYRRLWNAGSVA